MVLGPGASVEICRCILSGVTDPAPWQTWLKPPKNSDMNTSRSPDHSKGLKIAVGINDIAA